MKCRNGLSTLYYRRGRKPFSSGKPPQNMSWPLTKPRYMFCPILVQTTASVKHRAGVLWRVLSYQSGVSEWLVLLVVVARRADDVLEVGYQGLEHPLSDGRLSARRVGERVDGRGDGGRSGRVRPLARRRRQRQVHCGEVAVIVHVAVGGGHDGREKRRRRDVGRMSESGIRLADLGREGRGVGGLDGGDQGGRWRVVRVGPALDRQESDGQRVDVVGRGLRVERVRCA
jgi:hypothetical protein